MAALHLTSGFPGNGVICITGGIIFLGGGDDHTLLHPLEHMKLVKQGMFCVMFVKGYGVGHSYYNTVFITVCHQPVSWNESVNNDISPRQVSWRACKLSVSS